MSLLREISISNYRSIQNIDLDCMPLEDGSTSLGLIGLNEAGKSSVLKAIASVGGVVSISPKDFRDKSNPVEVYLDYDLSEEEIKSVHELVTAQNKEFEAEEFKGVRVRFGTLVAFAGLKKSLWVGLYRDPPADDDPEWFAVASFPPGLVQSPIFWTAADNYLIAKPISLAEFAADPTGVSIPLRNCFLLAGISDIPHRIASLQDDSTEIELLARDLGAKVTEHIQRVWPKHPVEITFLITGNVIHFHVRDRGTNGRAKTADQRSDGFRQFVSFLLTVSAQDRNEELTNAILLLDEPETHLHPLAQEYLLAELIQITKNKRGNAVVFATHSNYMIDKADLSRNFRVVKTGDQTELKRLDRRSATYASVSYEVFSIASTDYHNELYAVLHDRFQDEDPTDEKREWVKVFDEQFLSKKLGQKRSRPWKGKPNQATLTTFIRNSIHHPDKGTSFTEAELRSSIELMRKEI